MASQFKYQSPYSDEVRYHLDNYNFDGPLDILLDMIKEKKIEIKDLFISDITQQFVQYVRNMDNRDYQYIADFIKEAATLLYLKSTKFFPKIEESDDELGSALSENDLYIMRLEEYNKIKNAAEELKSKEILYRFYHEPLFSEDDYRVIIKGYDVNKLIRAFKFMLENVVRKEDSSEPQMIVKERVTVATMTKDIAEIIREMREVNFYSLFAVDYDKLDVLNTFLAVLEVLKQGVAIATILPDGDILLKHNPQDTGADIVYEEETDDAKTTD